jgi:CRP/FNR family cyclic AMP-dependent transcriptional regulator
MTPADLLAGVPLFEGLTSADRDELAGRLAETSFGAGASVFVKGEPGAAMYIVLSGSVQVFLPPESHDVPRLVLRDLRPGDYFGELSLFDDKPRSASVEALTETVLLQLTRDELTAHLASSKRVALAILGEMAERLRETNALLSHRAATNALKDIEDHLTWGQRFADKVAAWNGSWGFILFILGLTAGWSVVNVFRGTAFDPYPYVFYNLALTILIALQGPLIVMSQNQQVAKDRAQAESDFRVNLKNEVGIDRFARELAAFREEAKMGLEGLERR